MADSDTQDAAPAADEGSGDLFNTAAGWVLFAAGLGLGLSIVSGKYFHGDDPERPEQLGYVIEGAELEGGADQMTIAEALSLVSAEDGEKVFAKCSACHNIASGGANGIGPNLYGVMGAPIGKHPGYDYSAAVASHGGQWGWDEMNEWLANPRGYIDGTKMGFAGLSSIEDRAAVSLYMNELGGKLTVPEFVAPADGETLDEGDETEAGGSGMVTESELEKENAEGGRRTTPSL